MELTKPENAPESKAMPRVTPIAANCIPPCYEKVRLESLMAGNITFAASMSLQVLTEWAAVIADIKPPKIPGMPCKL